MIARKNILKQFWIYSIAIFCLSSNSGFCQNFGSDLTNNQEKNDKISREIENILLFSDQEMARIDLMNEGKKKDDFVIGNNSLGTEKKEDKQQLDFKVVKAKNVVNIDVRKKERIAYNAFLSKQYEVAIELYKQILQVEPKNNYVKYSLATIYQKMNQNSQAKDLYRELLLNRSENREQIIANMLIIFAEESPKSAIYLLSRLKMQNPDSAYLFAQTGLIYDKMKKYDEAIENLQKATQKDRSRVDYQYNLAIIYDKNKDYKNAIQSYYDVVKNYKNDKKWEKYIPINQVRSRISTLQTMI